MEKPDLLIGADIFYDEDGDPEEETEQGDAGPRARGPRHARRGPETEDLLQS